MKVMVVVKSTPGYENGEMPDVELLQAMTAYNEELVKSGVMLAGEGLKPTRDGARIHMSGDQRTVTRGETFGVTEEVIAGYWIWQVKDLDEAIQWAKRCPNPMGENCHIDIRPQFSADDFADIDTTGEIRAREEDMRRQLGEV